MKNQNRISQLTLELYCRGLSTRKERKLVENVLVADSDVRKQYEAMQKSENEIQQLVAQELNRMNIPKLPPVQPPSKRKIAVGLLLAAAVLLYCLIPAILYLRSGSSNKDNTLAKETTQEIIEEIPNTEITAHPEQPINRERGISNDRIETAEDTRTEPARAAEQEFIIEPDNGVYIASETDTGIRTRGTELAEPQSDTVIITDEMSNINIPPGMSFIFDNMFANKDLSFVVIPSRIKSIGKNAFAGNPLVSVTIGVGVNIEDNAIPGNFAAFYNSFGKAGGTYTRTGVNSETWEKNESTNYTN